MKNKKIILDTNLWISFLITKKLDQLELIENKDIRLIFSNELIEEFIDVVSRPKFKKYFSKKDIEKIMEYFDQFGTLVKVKSNIKVCRDEKDNFLLDNRDLNAPRLAPKSKIGFPINTSWACHEVVY